MPRGHACLGACVPGGVHAQGEVHYMHASTCGQTDRPFAGGNNPLILMGKSQKI